MHLTVPKKMSKINQRVFENWPISACADGSTLEAMGGAIDNAAVVVICFSESYQYSSNCRMGELFIVDSYEHVCSEAEYASYSRKHIVPVRTENYKATSWLGIILGAKLYFNCMSVTEADECAMSVAGELGERGKAPAAPP